MFTTFGPVKPGSSVFMGREAEFAQIEKWLNTADCVGAIMGARQTGKTTLALQAQTRLSKKFNNFAFIDLEALVDATAAQCFAYLSEEVSRVFDAQHHDSSTVWPTESIGFSRFLRELGQRSKSIRLVIALDEVGALPSDTAVNLAHSIRAIFTMRHKEPVYCKYVFILLGANEMLALSKRRNSPLRNVTESIYLNDLSADDVHGLMKAAYASSSFPSEVSRRVFYWTNGHPYLTQMLGKLLARNQGSPSIQAVDRAVTELLQMEDANLPALRKTIEQSTSKVHDLVKSFSDGNSVPFRRSDTAVAELELIGLIRNHDGFCRIRNRIYERAFLAGTTGNGPNPKHGGLWYDEVSHQLYLNGEDITTEISEPQIMQLLIVFSQKPGVVFRKDELASEVWHHVDGVTDEAIAASIRRARKALQELEAEDSLRPKIETVKSVGYRLRNPD